MLELETLATELSDLLNGKATKRYGLEHISQLEHALQSADLAEKAGEPPAMVLAALLHDVGHLVHVMGENPAAEGRNDVHEVLGAKWLAKRGLPQAVTEPVRLHVEAKRFLCATEPGYADTLAPDSVLSLDLQGGPMSPNQAAAFRIMPHAENAVRLRRYDDLAKVKDAATPGLAHFLALLPAAAIGDAERKDFAARGFLVLRDFFSEAEAAQLRSWADQMGAEAAGALDRAAETGCSPAALAAHGHGLIVVAEAHDALQVCRFEYLLGAHAGFRAFTEERILPIVSAVGGEAFVPFKDKENEKHAGGGAFRPHQDFAAYQSFGPRYNITAMLSVDAATKANGCLDFAVNAAALADDDASIVRERIDGRPLLAFYEGGPQNGDIRDDIAARLDWQTVETSPRDLVLFDSFVPHRSAENATDASRRAVFITCNAAREGDWYARYYADKRANYDDPKFHVSTPTAFASG